jgi:hypothetical protein
VRVYRINAVSKEGKAIVLGTADTASQALKHVRDAIGEYPRAWVTDDQDLDVAMPQLISLAEEEEHRGDG